MTFLISLFAISLLAIVGMTGLKIVELHSGRRFSFLRWRYKSDHLVRRTMVHVREYGAIKKAQGYLLLIKYLRHLIDLLIEVRKYLLLKSAKFFDIVKGKGHFGHKGTNTFFRGGIDKTKEIVDSENEK